MNHHTQLSLRLDRLQLLHHTLLRREMSALGLWRGQPPLLEYVLEHEGCTQVRLSEELGISPASVAISTKRLERAGLLEKRPDETNLRCNQLFVTALGKEKAMAAQTAIDRINHAMFEGLSDAECEVFQSYLDRLIRNFGDNVDHLAPIENYILANKLHGKAR